MHSVAIMSKREEHVKRNRGIALIVALLTLLVLSTLGTSLLFITETEIRTSYNFKLLTQARYAAEAGTQSTLNWLVYSYTAPTDYSVFNMNVSPVTYMGQPVVLSAMDDCDGRSPYEFFRDHRDWPRSLWHVPGWWQNH